MRGQSTCRIRPAVYISDACGTPAEGSSARSAEVVGARAAGRLSDIEGMLPMAWCLRLVARGASRPGSRAMLAMRRPHRHQFDAAEGALRMRLAVVNETSAVDKHQAILAALDGRGLRVVNAGMAEQGETPELQYIHTGLISALLLATDRVDMVIGGCGTGEGFMNAVMQDPGVACGHLLTSLDAFLFARINAGNVVSLALNQGWGWLRGEPAPPLRPALPTGTPSGRGTRPIARRPNERPASGCSSSRRPPTGPWRRSWGACPMTSSSRP